MNIHCNEPIILYLFTITIKMVLMKTTLVIMVRTAGLERETPYTVLAILPDFRPCPATVERTCNTSRPLYYRIFGFIYSAYTRVAGSLRQSGEGPIKVINFVELTCKIFVYFIFLPAIQN